MKALIVIIGMALYKFVEPAPLEAWSTPDYTFTEVKRKVPKRKKGNPLKRKAPHKVTGGPAKVTLFKDNSKFRTVKNNFNKIKAEKVV